MDKRRHLAAETGLYTAEVFEVLLGYETARSKRYPSSLTLLHLALDTEGYTDDLRKQAHEVMAGLLNRMLRLSDVPSHYHDEYLILLPATDETGGRTAAERILASYRASEDLAARAGSTPCAYAGLTTKNGSSLLSWQHLVGEAAVAMNEARLARSLTCIAHSDVARERPGGE